MLLVPILVIMAATVSAGVCPLPCDCRTANPDAPIYVSCKSDDNVTLHLPDNTEALVFEDGFIDFETLMHDLCSMQHLPYFSQLILKGVALPNLSNISVNGLDRLRKLEISNCQLAYLPEINLTSLQILELYNNKLSVIDDGPLRTLHALEVLNLSGNAIETISPNGFANLASLKNLDLSRNNLTTLVDNVFNPLETLQHLNLSNNKLQVLNEACFGNLLYLQQLDVSWNRLARVAPGSLQLPSLARLLLAGNPQLGGSREPTLFVGTGRRLQTVDASRTGLKQVPAALTHSIRTLRLAGNSIRTVRCGDVDSYPLLQLLDFTSNDLLEIEEDALGRLDSLTILYLTDNNLRAIPHSLPERLRVLHLENNKIETIQPMDLQGMSQLEVLLLSHNEIKNVKEAAFSQLTSLNSLDLSYNPISVLPTGCLAGPTQLRVLRLAGLSVIQTAKEVEFPLSSPEHLITLDLSNSPSLARQMLADTAALAASRELQELNLAYGGLNYIRSDLLHFLPQLRIMHLHDNPLNCSGLQWLADWMRREDEPEYRTVLCASPPELWGTLLVDIQSIEPETTINHPERKDENNSNNNGTYAEPGVEIPLGNGTDNSTAATVRNDKVSTQIPAYSTTIPEPIKKIAFTPMTVKTTEDSNFMYETANGYTEPMNILTDEKVNSVDGNLFMKKSLRNVTETTWVEANVTAEMSMYSGESRYKKLAHPGMLILALGVLVAAGAVLALTTRITRRNRRLSTHEDIEVSSLPSVTELW